MRGRARALVDPRGVPRPAAADPDAEPEAVTRGRRVLRLRLPARRPLNKRRSIDMAMGGEVYGSALVLPNSDVHRISGS
ncbi:hypothetical protein C2845_PM08G27400 [Panicum miliaceum]|uniref:Uncharacterized protein n=1 Tax=Panicum miliaceum TaxID=4540 RepID=A0A3L6R396_PANMI|nr:hypothetical protein C2845_PM08G27400 [Panicum miliaceum]